MDHLSEKETEEALNKIEQKAEDFWLRFNGVYLSKITDILYTEKQTEYDRVLACALERAAYLSEAYKDMATGSKYMASLHLIRLNLDNVLRVYAGEISSSRVLFAKNFISGMPVNKMKDKEGQFMRDSHLVSKLGDRVDWVEFLYKKTCGYIHFSDTHYRHIFNNRERGRFGDHDGVSISLEERLGSINEMMNVNQLLIDLIDRYLSSRD